jgi:cytidylate kinase
MDPHESNKSKTQGLSPIKPKIGIVGVCAAGKSTVAKELIARGYNVKPIAQEHSYVPQMWQLITKPDILIFLEVDYTQTVFRRQLNWTQAEYKEQLYRLRHAREFANLVIDTTNLSINQVLETITSYLTKIIS